MAPPARAEAIPPAIAPNIITSLKWLETNNLFNNLIQRNQSAAFSSGKVRPNHETNINIIARRTGKDVNSHTVLDGIITTIMATIQRINIIGSREGSRNRRRLKANQTGKKFRVGIKSNISTNRNNLISGVDRCIHLNAMKKTTITSINRQTIKYNVDDVALGVCKTGAEEAGVTEVRTSLSEKKFELWREIKLCNMIKLLNTKPTALRLVSPSAAKIKIFTASAL